MWRLSYLDIWIPWSLAFQIYSPQGCLPGWEDWEIARATAGLRMPLLGTERVKKKNKPVLDADARAEINASLQR